ncbi:helix-turn-helix transcriptional regulator [Streptosporangium sp. NBC_01495]|uniref:helix-turn-helix domain-containing protein n=1 Tax=Streptosporangium sp. NBC_01495 TaxID=2903899 RepID=UPI002E30386E|nr:helix-turn-helix transcriptional regulator [Streptosporangium sp. NBC_01495]
MTEILPADLTVTPRHYFGQEVRRLRSAAGFSQKQLAKQVPVSVSHLSMIETGTRPANHHTAEKLDAALDSGTTLVDLLNALEKANSPVPRWFRPWVEFEREAEALHIWELSVFPGLLQTEDYARALLSREPDVDHDQAEGHVAARLHRQTILDRLRPPMLWVVIDEGVLHRPVGSPEIMFAQLNHLLKMGERLNISLQILPYNAYSVLGLLGTFTVAELPRGASPMAYVESQPAGNRIIERAPEVRGLTFRHGVIRTDAISRRESLHMIKEKAELWT